MVITHYIDWALPDTGIFPQVTNIYSKTLTSNIAIDGEDRWHGRLLIAHHDSKCFVLSWLYDGWITTYTLGVYLTERDRNTPRAYDKTHLHQYHSTHCTLLTNLSLTFHYSESVLQKQTATNYYYCISTYQYC